MRSLLLPAVGALLYVSLAFSDTPPKVKQLSAADIESIKAVVTVVRRAILNESVDAILRNITRTEGLVCTDSLYSYSEVKGFLRDKSCLHP